MVGTILRPSGEKKFSCSAGCKAFVQFMRVDCRKPCISDRSFIVVSTKFLRCLDSVGHALSIISPHPHLNCPRRSSPLVLLVRSSVLVFIETCAGGRDLPFCTNFGRCNSASGPDGSVVLHLETIGLFIRGKIRRVLHFLHKTQTILYKRHIKMRLSQDASYRRTGVRGCS